jgi:hypothetical protein
MNSSRISNELAQISAGNLQMVIKSAQDEIEAASADPSNTLENQRDLSDKVAAA